MATVATRRESNDVPRTAQIDLTPTGLLMEGVYTQNRVTGEIVMSCKRGTADTLTARLAGCDSALTV